LSKGRVGLQREVLWGRFRGTGGVIVRGNTDGDAGEPILTGVTL